MSRPLLSFRAGVMVVSLATLAVHVVLLAQAGGALPAVGVVLSLAALGMAVVRPLVVGQDGREGPE